MTRFARAALLALLSIMTAPAAHAADTAERWYVVEVQGQRAGWMREFTRPEGENILTGMEMQISFGRAGMTAKIGIDTRFVETPEGVPVSMRMTQRLGTISSTTEFTFGEGEVTITARNAGQEFTQTAPFPEGEYLTPAAATRYIEAQLAAGAESITTRLLTPVTGLAPMASTMHIEGRETIEVLGRSVPAVKSRVESDVAPGQAGHQYTDEKGHVLRTEQNIGAMTMVVIAADKSLALSELDVPEIMANTFIAPTGAAITDPRDAVYAQYVISAPDDLPIPAFSGGAQDAERREDGTVLVTVNLKRKDTAPSGAEHLESTTMLAADDPVVTQLAERAGNDPWAMRSFVHSFVTEKSLGVGFASASEVARTRTGDCTEHAMLLAAMLRAAEIPSRVVTGLVYTQAFAGAQDVFGFHAWVQGHINGRWVDLDPTLPSGAFDAAHIALGVSPMSDGELVNSLVDVAPLIGTLSIEVLKIK